MEDIDHLAHMPQWRAGAWGGCASSLAQFIGSTLNDTVSGYFDADYIFVFKNLTVFGIATCGLAILGAIVGRFCNMKNRWSIFLAGASATAILTMAAPALKPLIKKADWSIVSTAQAAETSDCTYRSNLTIGKGLKNFFGLDDAQYRVVIGSFKKPEDARALASKVNADNPGIKATVSERAPCNDYFAVTVGGGAYLSVNEARKLQSKVLGIDGVSGAYLSPEP